MQKGLAFLSVSVSATFLVLLAVACGENDTSEFVEKDGTDASFDTGPGFVVDANTEDGSAPVSCSPVTPAAAPAWKAPAKSAACSEQELGEYYDACLTPNDLDAGDPCETWRDAHTQCRDCIEPADNSGPIQWYRDRYYYTLNVAGCIALERNEPSEGQCPAAYNAAIQCRRDACDGCFQAPNATFQDFQKCQGSAKGSVCSSYSTTLGNVCGSTYDDPDGGAYDCFRKNEDESPKGHFVRVEGIFCRK